MGRIVLQKSLFSGHCRHLWGEEMNKAAGVGALIVAALLCGCPNSSFLTDASPESRDQVAAALISVNTVAPWSQVAEAVQPNFALKADEALAQVVPTTARIQEQILSAFGATLALGLPQTSRQTTATTTGGTSTQDVSPGTTTTTTTSSDNTSTTTTRSPGIAPQVPTGIPANAALPGGQGVAGNIDIDPMLKYQAALALYQQVQLMNRQVQNVLQMTCYAPFLVQMKLSLLPYRRNLPFDLHGRVSFFPGKLSPHAPMTGIRQLRAPAGHAEAAKALEAAKDNCAETDLPFVVPLLVTDDIERAIKSRAAETAQQIGFALSAMQQGVGANASVNNLKQAIDAVSAQDFNSRYTVARLADNTLYLRIGAANQASGGNALVGQTYDVSLLLLIPKTYFPGQGDIQPTIRVVSHTEFREASSGRILPSRGRPALVASADMVMRDTLTGELLAAWNSASADEKQAITQQLACPIQSGGFDIVEDCGPAKTFAEVLHNTTLKTPKGQTINFGENYLPKQLHESFWTRLSAVLADSSFKSAFFPLPVPPVVRVPDQTALLQDDSKDSTVVLLRGVSNASSETVTASLRLVDSARERDYVFPAQALTLDPAARVLSLTFPSLSKWGVVNFNAKDANTGLTISQAPCRTVCPQYEIPSQPLKVLYVVGEEKQAEPRFTFVTKQIATVATGGKAVVGLSIAGIKDDAVIISGDNVDILAAMADPGGSLAVDKGKVTVVKKVSDDAKGPVSLTLQMQGVNTGMTISITAQGKKADKETTKQSVRLVAVEK